MQTIPWSHCYRALTGAPVDPLEPLPSLHARKPQPCPARVTSPGRGWAKVVKGQKSRKDIRGSPSGRPRPRPRPRRRSTRLRGTSPWPRVSRATLRCCARTCRPARRRKVTHVCVAFPSRDDGCQGRAPRASAPTAILFPPAAQSPWLAAPRGARAGAGTSPPLPLPPPSRTNWTRLVPPSVLTGHAPRGRAQGPVVVQLEVTAPPLLPPRAGARGERRGAARGAPRLALPEERQQPCSRRASD